MEGKLIIISAPSGAGKTSIVNHLLSSGLNIMFSISATSRAPRQGEKDGSEYWFMSASKFRERISRGDFIEWEEVYPDHYYGTLKSEIDQIWAKGYSVIFDVDVKGGINLKRIFGDRALSIFIKPPSVDELNKRLVSRGTDSADKIEMRVAKARREMKQAGKFDKVIINDKLENACKEAIDEVSKFLDEEKKL